MKAFHLKLHSFLIVFHHLTIINRIINSRIQQSEPIVLNKSIKNDCLSCSFIIEISSRIKKRKSISRKPMLIVESSDEELFTGIYCVQSNHNTMQFLIIQERIYLVQKSMKLTQFENLPQIFQVYICREFSPKLYLSKQWQLENALSCSVKYFVGIPGLYWNKE